jgi:hypothetical protein
LPAIAYFIWHLAIRRFLSKIRLFLQPLPKIRSSEKYLYYFWWLLLDTKSKKYIIFGGFYWTPKIRNILFFLIFGNLPAKKIQPYF